MSEMTKQSGNRINLRATLLATACGAALLVAVCASDAAMASDADRPLVWVELGGAFTQLDASQENYLPPFTLGTSRLSFITDAQLAAQKPVPTSWDGNAKLTFEPSGLDWRLSAGIVYGHTAHDGALRQQTAQPPYFLGGYFAYQTTTEKNNESHMILDFQAGKDVGLGVFGSNGHSTVNFGVRYAQLTSNSDTNVAYQPTDNQRTFHKFDGSFAAARKFTGIGPSLSWDASAGLIGDATGGGISLDWGVNGAVLFGRQKLTGHHLTSGYAATDYGAFKHSAYSHSFPLNRSKQVVVPNFGGFASVSWRYPNAKISMGYRADMFFGAMDGGIDTRKSENVGFYGPFASVSIGLGG